MISNFPLHTHTIVPADCIYQESHQRQKGAAIIRQLSRACISHK